MLTDLQLQQNAIAELRWEPSVNAADIGVAAADGVVTLSGSVGTYSEKFAAERAVERATGVHAIADELTVRLPGLHHPSDADIARSGANSLAADVEVPDGVTVVVRQGWLTLEGTVRWFYQKAAAERAVRYLAGVTGITNMIDVVQPKSADPKVVKSAIEAALERNVEIDARNIQVTAHEGTVALKGAVRSWAERDDAVRAAWNAPGVRFVKDELLIKM